MIYYFDTNTLVTTQRDDFPIDKAPDFWSWLLEQGNAGVVKLPEAVFGELGQGDDLLARWVNTHRKVFLAPMTEAIPAIQTVLDTYENPMTDITLETIQVDATIIAHALACPTPATTVVTYEKPKNATVAKNKKIPNICAQLGVPCIRFPQFIWTMSKLGKP